AVAGVAYAFGGVFLNCLTWVHTAAALGWMPWVVLLLERCWRGSKRDLLNAAMIGALQMLTGSPEIILLTWLLVSANGIFQWASTRHSPIPMRLIAVVVLVTALTAVQLLPFLDFLQHSQRTSSYAGSAWAMPLSGWANFLVPLFNSMPSNLGVFG